MGQDRDVPGAGTGDEFDEIRARVDRIRREAQQRIDQLRGPTGLGVRLPPRPGTRRPGPPASPAAPTAGAPAAPGVVPDRPAPPSAEPAGDWRGRVTPPPPAPFAESEVHEAPAPTPPVPPVRAAAPMEPVPSAEPADAAAPAPAPAGRTIPVEDLPPPGAG